MGSKKKNVRPNLVVTNAEEMDSSLFPTTVLELNLLEIMDPCCLVPASTDLRVHGDEQRKKKKRKTFVQSVTRQFMQAAVRRPALSVTSSIRVSKIRWTSFTLEVLPSPLCRKHGFRYWTLLVLGLQARRQMRSRPRRDVDEECIHEWIQLLDVLAVRCHRTDAVGHNRRTQNSSDLVHAVVLLIQLHL